ncbi:hypothetical protein KC19_4G066700 [Ceratodon purpureus]|uniref:Uncharacterized protein n=1 Tax=Ceratodon purpureus TaxID=3225 RepID=A0A8T0I6B7_CERPU|nr:hypothetical protein KC19_4G066700 [Ceratodon purpureus]
MVLPISFLFLKAILVLRTINYVNASTCNSITDSNGLSSLCSSLSLTGGDKLLNLFPSGIQVSFNITTLIKECVGLTCVTSNRKCTRSCPCCRGYGGADPGFKATIVALDNSSSTYTQNLTCSFSPYVANSQGFYFFDCVFKGYGLASLTKLIIMQISWNNMPVGATLNFNMYITAGSVSLPDSLWNWERGNKFPINEYGIFKILLYDAYGNKVSASTGSIQPNVQIDATFQRSEINLLSNKSETIVETTPTIKITWQMAYGFCVISVYAKKEGMFKMTVRDNHNIILGNMPTTFYVTPDESWTGTRFKPPPAPKTYFLGDNYVGSAAEVQKTLNLWLAMSMLLCTLVTVLEIPYE